jgi:hypothetical protein
MADYGRDFNDQASAGQKNHVCQRTGFSLT